MPFEAFVVCTVVIAAFATLAASIAYVQHITVTVPARERA